MNRPCDGWSRTTPVTVTSFDETGVATRMRRGMWPAELLLGSPRVRRKVGLYIEHGVGGGVGGAELLMAALASAWSHSHDVDLIHHRPALTKERFANFTAIDLSRVRIRTLSREPASSQTRNLFRRYRRAV